MAVAMSETVAGAARGVHPSPSARFSWACRWCCCASVAECVVETSVLDGSCEVLGLERDLAGVLGRAAVVSGTRTVPWPGRERAASLCKILSSQVYADEALCADLVRSASACVDSFPVVHDLLVAACELAPDQSKLVAPLLRLCAGAHAAGHRATVVVALFTLTEVVAFDGEAPGAWLVGTGDLDDEAAYWLRHLVRRWTLRFGGSNEGVREVIRDRQDDFFVELRMPVHEILRLHAAEPTPAGWIALANRRDELKAGPLPISFGDRRDDAEATVRDALQRRLEPGAHTALERWHTELLA